MNKISSRTILLVIIYVHDTEFKQFLFWWYENIFLYILKYILYITKISLCQSRPRFQKSWKLENFIVSDEFKKVFWTLFEGMLMQNKHFHFFETLLERKIVFYRTLLLFRSTYHSNLNTVFFKILYNNMLLLD